MTTVGRIKSLFVKGFALSGADAIDLRGEMAEARAVSDNLTYDPAAEESIVSELGCAEEIDFSRQGDLESYARGLKIPSETIERWISAGLLLPDEIKAAQKILKILRRHN